MHVVIDQGLTTSAAEFADVLEQFESQFYQQALQKFQTSDFTSAGFVDAQVPVQQFTQIQLDESTHQTVLEVRLFVFFAEMPQIYCGQCSRSSNRSVTNPSQAATSTSAMRSTTSPQWLRLPVW